MSALSVCICAGLFGSNHMLLRRTFLDPGLDNTLRQAYPRLSSFSIA